MILLRDKSEQNFAKVSEALQTFIVMKQCEVID